MHTKSNIEHYLLIHVCRGGRHSTNVGKAGSTHSCVKFLMDCCSKVVPSNIQTSGLNSEFYFSYHTKVKELCLPYYLAIPVGDYFNSYLSQRYEELCVNANSFHHDLNSGG